MIHSPVAQWYPAPRDRFLIQVNRYIAGRLGLDPRFTVSSNIAIAIARATGMQFATAKRLFHAGVAGVLAAVLNIFGVGIMATLGAGAAVWAWLESYDDSAHRR